MKIKISTKFECLFKKKCRYFVFYGGRGGGKTESIADFLLFKAASTPISILCGRERQNSLKDSVYKCLRDKINEKPYWRGFQVMYDRIRHKNGSEFIFKSLSPQCANSTRSLYNFHICWIEEAQFLTQETIETLRPSLRAKDSFFILSGNPMNIDSPFAKEFILSEDPSIKKIKVNYNDNPFFPDVLEKERLRCELHNPTFYRHIWLGEFIDFASNAVFKNKFFVGSQELKGKIVVGMDFGFAKDPTVVVFAAIDGDEIYIFEELFLYQEPIDNLANKISEMKHSGLLSTLTIKADNARPELIEILSRSYKIEPCVKPANSVKAGIDYLLSKKITINPECKFTIEEFNKHSFRDKIVGNNYFIDDFNHAIDSLRYALQDEIFPKQKPFDYSGFF